METIDLGSFSIDNDTPVKVDTRKQVNQIGKPKTKALQNALIKIPQVKMPKVVTNSNRESAKEHQDYILMLSRYGTSPRFGDYLKSLTFKLDIQTLKKQSVEELEEMLQRVRTSIANRTINDVWSSTIFGGLGITENIVGSTSLSEYVKLKGLSEALKEDDGFMDLLEEIKLSNQNLAYVSTETRLMYTILTTTLRVHSLNTLMDKRRDRNRNVPSQAQPTNNKPSNTTTPEDKVIDLSD